MRRPENRVEVWYDEQDKDNIGWAYTRYAYDQEISSGGLDGETIEEAIEDVKYIFDSLNLDFERVEGPAGDYWISPVS